MKLMVIRIPFYHYTYPKLLMLLILCIICNLLLSSSLRSIDVFNSHPNGVEIPDVPMINQLPNLPTGCEATSTAMLLQWAGISVTKEEIAKTLPKGKVPYTSNGRLIGGNPHNEFIGNPFSKSGFGVFHRPIKDIINGYLPGKGEDITGCSFNDLLKVLDSGRPIVVWVTIGMAEPKVNSEWYDINGNKVVWKVPQHTVLLVGYNQSHVIFNDPLTGKKEYYTHAVFKDRWQDMGSQAVTIRGK